MTAADLRPLDSIPDLLYKAAPSSGIAVNRIRGERRQTNRDVFCATVFGRTVLDPLSLVYDNGLAGPHIESFVLCLDSKHAFQHDGELVELRSLSRFGPAAWALHSSNTGRFRFGVHPAN